jgi:hypothetical protein
MTRSGSFGGFETRSGTFYYWRTGALQKARLWKRTPNGDQEISLKPPSHFGGSISLSGSGFYYRAAGTDSIYLYEEKSARSHPVMVRRMPASFGEFTVSPDGHWLATGVVVSEGRNLLLMENFH